MLGSPGAVFSALEQALLRYIAAGLGVSYEQLYQYTNRDGQYRQDRK